MIYTQMTPECIFPVQIQTPVSYNILYKISPSGHWVGASKFTWLKANSYLYPHLFLLWTFLVNDFHIQAAQHKIPNVLVLCLHNKIFLVFLLGFMKSSFMNLCCHFLTCPLLTFLWKLHLSLGLFVINQNNLIKPPNWSPCYTPVPLQSFLKPAASRALLNTTQVTSLSARNQDEHLPAITHVDRNYAMRRSCHLSVCLPKVTASVWSWWNIRKMSTEWHFTNHQTSIFQTYQGHETKWRMDKLSQKI